MSLRALQRDFRAWLTQESAAAAARLGACTTPDACATAGAEAGAHADTGEDADTSAEGGTQAAPGLSVYLNTYRSQLLSCLNGTFGTVCAWMGDAAFNAAAATHIDRVAPAGWTLDDYGRDFPSTLDELHPGDPWIGELARLDWALAQVFVGPDSASAAAGDLGDVDWERAVLRLVPTFALLPARTNAAAIRSAIAAGTPPPPAALLPGPAQIAVWRREFTPCCRALDRGEAEALAGAAGGVSFGTLCAQLVERQGEAEGTARAGAWLGRWLHDGIIAAVDREPTP